MMHIMIRIYEQILVSSIFTAQNNGIFSDVWKFNSNFTIATSVSANVLFIFLIVNNYFFPNSLDFLIIKYTGIGKYDFLLNMLFYVISPVMIYNHFKYYKNNKYKKLISENMNYYSKLLFAIYFIISFAMPIVYIFSNIEFKN